MYKDNPQTNYRIDLREKILRASMREFLHKGVKSVKMDDIANILGISKRTLYEIYSNKEELLLECVRLHEDEYDQQMAIYTANKNHNVIDVIIEFYRRQISNVSDATPLFFQQLRKYENVLDFCESRRIEREKNAKNFFQRGVSEGYFRSDVDYFLVMRIGGAAIDMIMHDKMYSNYTMREILHNVIFIIIRGFCTEEGIKKLDNFLNNNK